jgi:hypothetical protein
MTPMNARHVILAGALLAVSGCFLPGPMRPVQPPAYSALELQRDVTGPDSMHMDYAADATLRTQNGDTVRGRDRIQAYMVATATKSVGGQGGRFDFYAHRFYRCSAVEGIEISSFRMLTRAGESYPPSGRWFARWSRSGNGDWTIREAILARPGERLPALGPGCVGTGQEVAAVSRVTVSVHGPPFKIDTSHPYHDLRRVGTYPFYDRKAGHIPLILAVRYRVARWAAVGAMWARQRGFRDNYAELASNVVYKESLTRSGSIIALTAGYQGKDVSLDAGPALFRSHWEWTENGGLAGPSASYSHLGAVVQMRVVVPLASDFNLELIGQRRFVGDDLVPRTTESRSSEGWYLGVGFAIRRTDR